MILAVALAAMQLVLPSTQGMSIDQRITGLAALQAHMSSRLETVIYGDPVMRAEIRRVGFAKGCSLIGTAGRAVVARQAPALEPELEKAIRKVIPAERLSEARVLSFLIMPLEAYQSRVEAELERSAPEPLAAARDDMRRTFWAGAKAVPSSTDPADNEVAPKSDVALALGQKGNWDLDNPAQLRFACAEQRISPNIRPRFTTGEMN